MTNDKPQYSSQDNDTHYQALATLIKTWGETLGFAQVGISNVDLSAYESSFEQWLKNNYHGSMDYMARHGLMRTRPNELVPGTLRVISVRMNYLPANAKFAKILGRGDHAYISRYALGRDYHKLLRKRLKQLGDKISAHCEQLNFRPFVDSAPILERPLAEKAGLGWIGKHSLVINKEAGSWFFLGELLVDIPLPCDSQSTTTANSHKSTHALTQESSPERAREEASQQKLITTENPNNKCGSCVACIKICPTQAIVAPYVIDARRCISYLTIEHKGVIPLEFREPIGNRIYGCDDCQLICPWNKFAPITTEKDFSPRNNFDDISLLTLFEWDEDTFLSQTEGSPIRRIGYQSWIRNIAIALGNIKTDNQTFSQKIITHLTHKLTACDDIIAEHLHWAIAQQQQRLQHFNNNTQQAQPNNERLTARLVRSIEKGLPRDA